MKLIDFILADKHRYSSEPTGFWKIYWNYEGFRFTVWLRICQETRKKKITKYTIFPLAKLLYKHYKYNIDFLPFQHLKIYHLLVLCAFSTFYLYEDLIIMSFPIFFSIHLKYSCSGI